MHGDLAPEYGLWLESVVVLTAGTAVIVGLGVLASRLLGAAVWRRTIWQAATLGLLGLVLIEWTGTGAGLVRLCSSRTQTPETETASLPAPVDISAEEPAPVAAAKPPSDGSGGLQWPAFSSGPVQFAAPDDVAFADAGPWPAESWDTTPPARFDFGQDDGQGNPAADVPSGVVMTEAVVPQPEPASAAASTLSRPAVVSPGLPSCVWWPGLVWLLGTAVVASRTVFARLLLCALRRRQVPVVDAGLCKCVAGLARRLGIRRPVFVLQSGGLSAPVAFGSLRPTVLLPAGFAEEFDRRQQEAMLAHELAHLRAGDPAWQLAADLACALLWWHPLAWWSRRRLCFAGEAAADEASLLVPDGPGVLASCLVSMGRRFSGRPRLGWLSIEGPGFRSALGRRVERLLSLRAGPWRAPGRGRSVCVKTVFPVALVIVAITCTAWARAQATLNEGGTTMKVFSSSWRRSLAAVALVTLWGVTSGDAVAAEGQEGEGPKLEGELVLQGEGEAAEREKAEAREGEAAEREKAEAREGEAAEREKAEAREGEAAERERAEVREREAAERERAEVREREAAERERAEAREREAHERPDRPGGEGEERIMALRREHAALEERAGQIRRELEAVLREHGEVHPAVRELAGELERIQGRMREIVAAARGEGPRPYQPRPYQPRPYQPRPYQPRPYQPRPDQPRPDQPRPDQPRPDQPRPDQPQPPELRQLEELEREIHRLSEAGRHEEAEVLKRRGRELMEAMRRRQMDRPPEPARPAVRDPELERRIHHLRVAMENLHAAGMPDQAEMLARQIERMMQAMPGPRADVPRPDVPPEGPRPEGPDRAIQELRGQVDQLRREMAEIRGALRELLERER